MSEGCGGFAKQPQFLLLYDKEQEGKTRVSTQTEFVMYGLLLIESPVDMEYICITKLLLCTLPLDFHNFYHML